MLQYRETARIFFRGADNSTKKRVREKEKRLKQEIHQKLPADAEWRNGKTMTLRYPGRSGKKLTTPQTKWSDQHDTPYFCVSYRDRGLNTWGNWDLDKWFDLVDIVQQETGVDNFEVLGRPDEIEKFGGEPPEDKGNNLKRSIDLLNHCEFSITPESGSGFLSTACGAKTVTFGHENLRDRYVDELNYLKTPIRYVGSPNRTFEPETIVSALVGFLETT